MADIIFHGGEIITMDEKTTHNGKVEAVAVSGDTIIEVGSIEQVFLHKGPNTQMILLNGQTLMPGFIEPHQHTIHTCLMRPLYINIGATNFRCYAEIRTKMLDTIQTIANAEDGRWGLFFGWDPELILDLPALSSSYLDENFSRDIPIAVAGQSGHVAWVNTSVFSKAGITNETPNPPGGTYVRDKDSNLTGQIFEAPVILAVLKKAKAPSSEEMTASIEAQYQYYASVGLTTVTEMAYMPNPNIDSMLMVIANDNCPIRLGLYRLEHAEKDLGPDELREINTEHEGTVQSIGYHNDKLWEVGIKFIGDGSPHCGTCAVREPFMNTPLTENLGFPPAPQCGKLECSTEALNDTVKKLHLQGKQIAVHCHGERACEQILKIYEEILSENGDTSNKNRHRMEHCGLMTVDQISRAGKINIALSFFVDQLRFYAKVYKTDIFGDRVNRWTPLSEATKNGLTWTIHQDHPTFPGEASPFANMTTAVTRCHRDDPDHPYGPEYRVPIHEALKSYTVNAAWQLHLDHQVGTITQGKKADLVILSDNPYLKDPFKLEEIKVVETFIGGRRNNIGKMTTLASGLNVLKRDPTYDAKY